MKSQISIVEDLPLRRSIRLQNLPSLVMVEPSPPPQRRRLDIDGSFEPIGISEVLGEPEIGQTKLIEPQ